MNEPPSQDPAGGSPAWNRSLPDRRQRPTPMFSRYFLVGRRRAGRRDGERERVYVDRPGRWIVIAFFLLLGLSLADAYFTLDVMARGGQEANPVMRAALLLGDHGFIVLKTIVTVVGAGFLCVHKNWPLGRTCLWIAMFGYAAVTVFHMWGRYSYLEGVI